MTARPGAGSRTVGLAIVLGAVCALTLPFLAKPFHLDDDVYLKGSEQILRQPLSPLGGTQAILGQEMPTYHFTQHPPLVSYGIALERLVTGDIVEWQLHLAFLVFPLLAAGAMLLLAERFTESPVLATLLLVATPAFMVASHGLMTDMPFVGLSLAAMAAWIRGADRARPGLLFLAGGLLGLACLVQYRGLLLAPLMLMYVVLHRRRVGLAVAALSPAVVVLGLWSIWSWKDLGVVHFMDAAGWIPFTGERLLRDGLAYLSFLGGASLFPAFVLWIGRPRLRNPWFAGALVVLLILVAQRWAPDHTGMARWLLPAFVTTGAVMLGGLVPSVGLLRECLQSPWAESGSGGQRAHDQLFLLAVAATALASQLVLNLFASVRSLLLALPFLVLLWARSLDADPGRPWARRWLASGGLAGTLLVGLAVSVADLRLAVAHRELPEAVGRFRRDGERVWFTGEWGFRYYMEQRGYSYLTTADDRPASGDVVVVPDQAVPSDLHPDLLRRLRLVATLESRDHFPIKVMSFRAKAGFYSDFFGLVPWSLSAAPLERVRIFRVARSSSSPATRAGRHRGAPQPSYAAVPP